MWLHVEDHSAGIIQAMQFGTIGENYCLAPEPENELVTEELVRKICDILGKKFEDVVEFVKDRPNYDLRYAMMNEKARYTLGWLPRKHIKDELPKIVEYYQNRFKV